jgi:hypothetical protein
MGKLWQTIKRKTTELLDRKDAPEAPSATQALVAPAPPEEDDRFGLSRPRERCLPARGVPDLSACAPWGSLPCELACSRSHRASHYASVGGMGGRKSITMETGASSALQQGARGSEHGLPPQGPRQLAWPPATSAMGNYYWFQTLPYTRVRTHILIHLISHTHALARALDPSRWGPGRGGRPCSRCACSTASISRGPAAGCIGHSQRSSDRA